MSSRNGRRCDDDALESPAAASSYPLRRARELRERLRPSELRQRLTRLARAYEAALAEQALDPRRVDRLEDDLLELVEAIELILEGG